ncbi:HNH endonuclease family protein [Nocardiopsis sp. NPDC058631]|uniref:HNH endonuclease family protein n=1 Tax=Nocardiopsis sp. NPDC058631 TaxID=3346566 RepID=UPI0036462B01
MRRKPLRPSALTATVGALSLAALLLAPATAHAAAPVPLAEAVASLPVSEENREGYDRSLFPHWTDEDRDGCNTRMEVLIAEATVAPETDERCRLTGGEWQSYYDDRVHTEARGLDIDHMVPLAEAWDSGASEWTTARRRDYANDLGEEVALVAVTARENRAKADKDPAQWVPPSEAALCRYVTEWTAVKTRWSLDVDQAEADALTAAAAECPDAVVDTEPAA